MENLLTTLKTFITPDIVSKLSGLVGDNTAKTQSAVNFSLPALIGGLINKTSTSSGAGDVLKLLKDGNYDGSLLNDLSSSLGDSNKFYGMINGASNTLDSVFGHNLKEVTNVISKDSGVSSNSASSILGFLAAVIMSLIGKKVLGSNLNDSGLSGLLGGQKDFIAGLIPSGIAGLLGLAGLKKVASNVQDYKLRAEEETSSGAKKWLPWLLIALGLIALWLIWRGCNKPDVVTTTKLDTVKKNVPKKIEEIFTEAPKTGDLVMDSIQGTLGRFIIKKLPGGAEIIIAQNGTESGLIAFIEDNTKLADKETWFSFDRILFETNKATLKPSSQNQVYNITAIMKAYPNINLKIGGYTDNTGNPQANLKLSQERADAVMQAIIKSGIAPDRLKAEGYGDQFPVASNDTPEGRHRNRRVDVRVSKK